MNRHARRRAQREGTKGTSWDLIIAGSIALVILLIFIGNFLFPNLNLSSYAGASPRVLRKIGDRGVQRLENDWPEIKSFSYGYYSSDEEWPGYQIEKKDDTWSFTNISDKKSIDYAIGNLPDFYYDYQTY